MKETKIVVLVAIFILAVASSGWTKELAYSYHFDALKAVKSAEGVLLEIPDCTDCLSVAPWREPMLPVKGLKLLIPYGYALDHVEVAAGEPVEMKLSDKVRYSRRQYPLSYVGPDLDDGPSASIYGSDSPYPGKRYGNVMVQHKMGYDILVLNLFPADYLPALDLVNFYPDMTLVVHLTEKAKDAPRMVAIRDLETDRKAVLKVIDNPEVMESYPRYVPATTESRLEKGDYAYVIVAPNQFIGLAGDNTLEDLLAEKTDKGMTGVIQSYEAVLSGYTGRDNAEKLRSFIADAYNNWNTEYVLLVGDSDGSVVGGETETPLIPKRDLWSDTEYWYSDYIPADMYFVCLDGDFNFDGDGAWGEPTDGEGGGEVDLMYELYVGRLCADSADEVRNFVRKTLDYFTYTTSDPFMRSALMVGELLWATWPEYTWGGTYKDEIKDGADTWGYTTVGFPAGWTVHTLYDRDSFWSKSQLINKINSDTYSIINHLGHSYVDYNMKMYNSDADGLNNSKWFFAYSQGCYPGSFDNRTDYGSTVSSDCIAEHFTLKSKGMFAFIGNSRYGWGEYNSTNGSSQYYDRQFFDAIFGEGIYELGWVNADSKEDNIPFLSYGANRWCYFELNLFGDPEARLVCPVRTTADFDVSTDTACVGEAVEFFDASIGEVTSYLWDFGDGETSTEQHPTHAYAETGTYTVSLTVDGPCGEDTLVLEDYITVYTAPVAAFNASATEAEVGDSIEFTDRSEGLITSYLWDFGDGEASDEQSPSHKYEKKGTYTVTLTVAGPCGEDSESTDIEIVSPGGDGDDDDDGLSGLGGVVGCGGCGY